MVVFLYEPENLATASLLKNVLASENVSSELVVVDEDAFDKQRGAAGALLLDGNLWDSEKRSFTAIEHVRRLRLQAPPYAGTVIILTFLRPDDFRLFPGGNLLALPGIGVYRLPADAAVLAKTILTTLAPTEEQINFIQHELVLNDLLKRAGSLIHNRASRLFILNSELPKIRILCTDAYPNTELIEDCLAPIRDWWNNRKVETTEFFKGTQKAISDLRAERPEIQLGNSPHYNPDTLVETIESLATWPLGKNKTVGVLLGHAQTLSSMLDRFFSDLEKLSKA